MRGIAYNRDISDRKARRKKRISDIWAGEHPYYNNLHQYSKNKIHCSCRLCSCKTNQKYEHAAGTGNFIAYRVINSDGSEDIRYATYICGYSSHSGRRRNWKPSDLKKIMRMEEEKKIWKKLQ